MSVSLRIGTRDSRLALWQAHHVRNLLAQHDIASEIITIKSDGERDSITPLYEMGVTGVFTKRLDSALLSGEIDIAVHSLKDVPTGLAAGLHMPAVLKRGQPLDALVTCNAELELSENLTIATSSLRRRAQWLNRYPHHKFTSIRGNINTRLKKLEDDPAIDGVVFALAGIERIALPVQHTLSLDWMIPAPGQGALCIVCNESDHRIISGVELLNDAVTALETNTERSFLRHLMGGCSSPIGAYAKVAKGQLHLRGNILSIDGVQKSEIEMTCPMYEKDIGARAAEELLENGGIEILNQLSSDNSLS